jgi:PadR family transcriptional regulator, regulatory protein PadR
MLSFEVRERHAAMVTAPSPRRELIILFDLYRVRYMQPKMTLQTKMVLRLALQYPDREWYGLQMIEATGLPAGTIYPIIARLESYGWLESRWEDPAEHEAAGRPRRRYHRFTSDGAERARLALAPARRPGAAVPLHAARGSGDPGKEA